MFDLKYFFCKIDLSDRESKLIYYYENISIKYNKLE